MISKLYPNFTAHIVERDVNVEFKLKPSIVDQWPNQEFNYNEFGEIQNDISALSRATTVQEYEVIASRLIHLKGNDAYKGMSDEEILRCIKPNRIQDPCEITRFAEYMSRYDLDAIQKMFDDVKDVDKSDSIDSDGV